MIKAQRKLIRTIVIVLMFGIIVTTPLSYFHATSPPTASASTNAMPMPLECFAVADSVDQLVRMDRFTGTFTDIGATGTGSIEAIAMSLDSNTLYAANGGQFGTLNMTTGVFTAIGAGFGTGNNVDNALGTEAFNDVDSLSFDAATGILWGIVQTPNLIFAINTTTGTFIPNIFGAGRDYAELDLSTVPTGPTDTDDLGIHPITGEFYVVANGNAPPNADRIVRVNINPFNPSASVGYNAANGQISVTDVAPLTNAGNPIRDMEGFSFFNDGSFYGTTGNASGGGNNDTLWQIDLTGTPGAATVVGAFPSYLDYESVGCLTAGSNTMSGTVFCEPTATADGIFNAGDTAQNGAVVRLYRDNGTTPNQVDGSDTLIQTFTTGAGGTYNFEIGIAGNFVLDIDPAIIPGGSVYTVPVTPGNDHEVDFVNTGPQFSEYGNNDPGNDFGFTCAAVPASDLTVTKTDAPDPIAPGNDLTYTIGVSNLGPNAAVNGTLSDPLPAGTTFVSLTSAAGWTCTTPAVGGTGTINCSNPSVAVGGPFTFTLVVNVPLAYTTPNPIPNTATVGADNDSNAANNTASTTTALLLASPSDLTVAKSDAPDPIVPGNDLTYTIDVTNLGPNAAVNGTLSDPLPAGTTFVSLTSAAGWTCTTPAVGAGGTINCSNPSVAVGGPFTFSLVVNVPLAYTTPNPIPNTATVGADNDSNAANNTASTTTALSAADLTVTKTDAPAPIVPGNDLTYTIGVSNLGPDAAVNGTLSDPLPAGTTFVSLTSAAGWTCTTPAVGAGGTINCSNPSVAVGGPDTFTLVVNVPLAYTTPNPIPNTATVGADNDGNAANNTASTTTALLLASPSDLTVTKGDAPDPITAGSNLTYTIDVSNLGPNAAVNGTLSDPLPTGTTFVAQTPAAGWTCTAPAVGSGGTYSCSNPSVAVGGPYTFLLTVNVPAGYTTPNPIPNTATVGADNDSNAGNNTATADTTLSVPVGPDVTISKVDSSDPVQVGATFTYTIVVTNIGTVAQTNTTVTDMLPVGVSYLSDDAGCVVALPTLTCNVGTLNPATSATINITVSADTAGTVLNVANVAGDLAETNTANNTDDEPTTIVAPNPPGTGGVILIFDPAISKIGVLEPGGLGLTGERITWVITITNIGTAPGTNVIITDVMRPELRVDSLEIDDGLATIDGQTITFIIPSLDPGEVVVARIFTTVLRSPSDGMFDNTAVLTANGITISATAVIPVPLAMPDMGYRPSNRGR